MNHQIMARWAMLKYQATHGSVLGFRIDRFHFPSGEKDNHVTYVVHILWSG